MNKKTYLAFVSLLFSAMVIVICTGLIAEDDPQDKGSEQLGQSLDHKTIELVQSIRNADIEWDYTYFGLMPIKLSGATHMLQNSQAEIDALLLTALTDQNKFVAAHILLRVHSKLSWWRGRETGHSKLQSCLRANPYHAQPGRVRVENRFLEWSSSAIVTRSSGFV